MPGANAAQSDAKKKKPVLAAFPLLAKRGALLLVQRRPLLTGPAAAGLVEFGAVS